MRTTFVSVVFGAFICALGACSSSSSGGGGGTGATAGGGAGGSGATAGSGGSGGTSSSGVCSTLCSKAASANCSGQSQCVANCNQAYTTYPKCKSQIDALYNCGLTNGTWKCDPTSGAPKISFPSGTCTSEQSAVATCASSGTGGTGGGGTGGGGTGGGSTVQMPAGCVNAGTITTNCNPVSNEGCTGSGEACDYGADSSGNPAFSCFPPPNDVALNGSCDNSAGPYCQAKLHCDQTSDAGTGTCVKWCCSNSDCGGTGTCQALDAQVGTLGLCK